MKIAIFRYRARFGHFLRAEANASAPTYPVPPRTALLGLIGAVLGMDKDEPQGDLSEAYLALGGRIPRTIWHTAKLRKDPPVPLPRVIRAKQRIDKKTRPEMGTLIPQEWLWNPEFAVYAALPGPYQEELTSRIREQRWHFTPCMGLSEMIADLDFMEETEANQLPKGDYKVSTVVLQKGTQINDEAAFKKGLTVQMLRMPRSVSSDRVFKHATYYVERDGNPIFVKTDLAWKVREQTVIFL